MKSPKELILAAESALLADWRKSWALFLSWSLLIATLANLGLTPYAPQPQQAHAATTNLSGIIQVEGGASFGLALKSDGTVLAWGGNANGQLGNGTTNPSLTPTQVTGLGSGSGVIAISAGATHALALKSDGTVLAWGDNSLGRLGDGTTTQRLTPVQVTGLGAGSGVTAIDAGFTNSMALKSDGTVLCWGRNQFGNCGDGTVIDPRLTPVTVTGSATGIVQIKAGANFGLARKADGTVVGWGLNANGQLADGTVTTPRTSPVLVGGFGSGSGVIALAAASQAGAQFALALKSDGTVVAWGNNTNGQHGDGTTTQTTTPVQVTGLGSGSGVTTIEAGATHAMALKSDGTALAWGGNSNGQLGDGTTTQRLTSVQVSGLASGSGVTNLTCGDFHCYALKSDGTVLAWGSNSSGQLGDGTFFGQSAPVQTSGLGSGSGVTAVSAGNTHSLALKSDGTVLAWGDNTSGRLGDGTTTQRVTPVQVTGSATGITAVAAGSSHSLALKSDGTVWAWGNNSNGQLGINSTTAQSAPVQVTGSATGVTAIAAGSGAATTNDSFALKSDGSVIAWGLDTTNGQLGDGGSASDRLTPVQVTGLGSGAGVTAIAAGGTFGCALKSDGTVMCWGNNSLNQLGDGTTTTNRTTPVQTSGLGSGSGVIAIAASNQSGYALKSDGTVLAWGGDSSGQLGDGGSTNQSIPVQVSGLGSGSGVIAISAGGASACALKSDGTVLCWGSNTSGQLGDGTTSQRSTPVQVSNLGSGSGVTTISVGSNYSFARKSDGTVLAWGADGSGQLGDGAVYTKNLTPSNVLLTSTATGGSQSGLGNTSSIQVSQPQGGEQLTGGADFLILWNYSGNQVHNVRLSLSTDGGVTFPIPIITTTPTSGYYPWTVSATDTDTAVLKAEALGYGDAVLATSVSPSFSISVASPTTGSAGPTGGEGAGASTGPVEGSDTSSSGRGALTRDEANAQLPAIFPVDSLVKLHTDGDPGTESDSTVYYLGLDAKRHPFINAAAYDSWYPDFSRVMTIDAKTLAGIPLAAPILVRPGTYWVKIQSDPRTYYVEPGYKLRWIKDEAAAEKLGGPSWNRNIVDVDPAFFALYSTGPDIDSTYLATSWPSGTLIDASLNLQDSRKLPGQSWYVSGGKKRAFVPDSAFGANDFQSRFAWTHQADLGSTQTLASLPSGPDITGLEDGLFSLMH